MQRALQDTKKALPTVYAVVFEEDEHIIPEDFVILSKRLTRSTKTEYPNLSPQKQIPFLDDILSSLYDSDNTNDFDYVVYTNSDIALQNDFYDKVAAIISMGTMPLQSTDERFSKPTKGGRCLATIWINYTEQLESRTRT